jgi:diguanylate cyclase (GGDEF)-like protein
VERRNTILIMEEAAASRTVLRELFSMQYEIVEAETAQDALQILSENQHCIALILLSITLPEKQGITFLEKVGERGYLEDIPIVATMTSEELGMEMKLLDMGVEDIILKPFLTSLISKRINLILERYRYKAYLEKIASTQMLQLKKANEGLMDILYAVIEQRNMGVATHVRHIRSLSKLLLNEIASTYLEYGLTEEMIDSMANACVLHDIGKILIPETILTKKEGLTEEEYELVKTHSLRGMEFLSYFGNTEEKQFLKYAMEVSQYHHERWDGKGYPEGLAGDEIPLCAQVAGLMDCYDALITSRPYKPAVSHKEAVRMILNGECGMFSEKILHCFKKVEHQLQDYIQSSEPIFSMDSQKNEKKESEAVEEFHSVLPGVEQMKYLSSTRYLDSIILELDITQDVYCKIYPPVTEIPIFLERGALTGVMDVFFTIYVHPEDVKKLNVAYQKAMEEIKTQTGEGESSTEIRVLNIAGSGYSWYQFSLLGLRKYGGNPGRVLLVLKHIHDIKMLQHNNSYLVNILSEIREGLELLSQEEEKPLLSQMKKLASGYTDTSEGQLQSLLSDFNDTVFEYDLVSGAIRYSENFKSKFGSRTPTTLYELYQWAVSTIHPEDFQMFEQQFMKLIHGEKADALEFRYKNNCGNYAWCQKRATVQYNEKQKPLKVIGILMDISHYKNENAKLLEKSERDPMTGLYNKITTQDLIEQCFQESSPSDTHAMVVFDIDDFKSINDTCGHLSGDHAIQKLAEKIARYTRNQDIVGRVGGDEFMLLMKNMRDKRDVVKKVKTFMRELNQVQVKSPITVSMGIAIYPWDGTNYEELFCRADEALYASKRCGKNQWKFYSEIYGKLRKENNYEN